MYFETYTVQTNNSWSRSFNEFTLWGTFDLWNSPVLLYRFHYKLGMQHHCQNEISQT